MDRQEVISIAHAAGWPIGQNSELTESIKQLILEAQARERERIATDCENRAQRYKKMARGYGGDFKAAKADALRNFAASVRATAAAVADPTKQGEFDDCVKSPTGKHCEKWFANNNCTHCGTGECGAEVTKSDIQP